MSNAYPPQPRPYQGGIPQAHPQGTVVLVLAILGLVVCPVAGFVGWFMGNRALKEIDANPAAYNNRQMVSVGRILGIVAVALWIIGAAIYLIVLLVLAHSETVPSR